MYIYAFQWEFSLFNLNSCAVELAIPSHENFDVVICRLFLLLVYHDMSSNVSFLLMIEEILGSLGWFVLYGCSMLCSDHFHLFFFFSSLLSFLLGYYCADQCTKEVRCS